ncbi:MAG: hypothetical protein WBN04_21910 [Paracoccaceae bacterium]
MGLIFAEEGNQEDETSQQKEDAPEHRPEIADAGDDEADRRNDEQNPTRKYDMMVSHARFAPVSFLHIAAMSIFSILNFYSARATQS